MSMTDNTYESREQERTEMKNDKHNETGASLAFDVNKAMEVSRALNRNTENAVSIDFHANRIDQYGLGDMPGTTIPEQLDMLRQHSEHYLFLRDVQLSRQANIYGPISSEMVDGEYTYERIQGAKGVVNGTPADTRRATVDEPEPELTDEQRFAIKAMRAMETAKKISEMADAFEDVFGISYADYVCMADVIR